MSMDVFKKIMQGVAEKIDSGLILENVAGESRLATTNYLVALREEMGGYTSSICAIGNQPTGDTLRAAAEYANSALLEKLEQAYSHVALEPWNPVEKKDSGVSIFSRERKNPALDRTRSIEARILVANTLAGAVFQNLEIWRSKAVLAAFA